MTDTYRIVRFFFDDAIRRRIIKSGLSLTEAQKHCNDPETSSRTSTDIAYTKQVGPWFDAYEKE